MKETEITVQVFNDLEEIKSLLKNKGFEIIENYEMHDYYFSKLPINYLSELPYVDLIKNSFSAQTKSMPSQSYFRQTKVLM